MDIEDIIKDLKASFSKPYPEFYKRRIIIWLDPEEEFADLIDQIDLGDVKILKMTENNKFLVKKVLNFDDVESDFLLYCPLNFESKEDNWILDVFLYSEIFRADRISIEMSQMGLEDTASIRKAIKNHRKFFNAKARREEISKRRAYINNDSSLILAIMASICKTDMNPVNIIREVFKSGLAIEENKIYKEFVNYKVDEEFWKICKEKTGYFEEERFLYNLFKTIVLTGSARTMDQAILKDLDFYINPFHETFCFQFLQAWLRDSKDKEIYKKYIRILEDDLYIFERLKDFEVDRYEECDAYLSIDEVIIFKLIAYIKNRLMDSADVITTLEKRRVTTWYEDFSLYYDTLYYMAKIMEFTHLDTSVYHESEAKDLWDKYAQNYYKVDTYYRKFQSAYQGILNDSNPRLDDSIKELAELAEKRYKTGYLDKILGVWYSLIAKSMKERGNIPGIAQQKDFYKDYLKDKDGRFFVIISDAMRYEVARQLADDLEKEMQCKVEMKNMEGIFPTITPFGMAALLPNNDMSLEIKDSSYNVLVDGQRTDANYREKILKSANENSVVLNYDDLIQMKKGQRRDVVKGMKVIYIYHDRIDEAGHGGSAEVFQACDKAIDEIKNLLRIIVNDMSGVNVLITADHGFIYTHDQFKEAEKVYRIGYEGVVDLGRRYVLMNKDANPDHLMPVKFIDENSGLKGFTPKENIRIVKQGGGMNFVHGGVSLQEMMVPLISYKHLRTASKEYQNNKENIDVKPVEIKLISNYRKISNMVFNLSFYQMEEVSSTREASSFRLYFVDQDGRKISDEVRIIADKSHVRDNADRKFDLRFSLIEKNYSIIDPYYLIIEEENNKLPIQREEFTIDIPYAKDGYFILK